MAALSAVPTALSPLVAKAFASARAAGNLVVTSPTKTASLVLHGVVYRLHLCSPLPPGERMEPPPPPPELGPNPLADPDPGLLVAAIPNYNLVLKTYSAFPRHFLLCTSEYVRQSRRLADEDVVAAYSVLKSWETPAERLFCFFNSTPRSGALYRHRHLNFYPLPAEQALMCDILPEDPDPCVRLHPQMPFRCLYIRFGSDPTAAEVADAYRALLKHVQQSVGNYRTSYNMGLTKEWMVLAPRLHLDGGCLDAEFNGTLFAGEVVIRRENSWTALRDGGLEETLRRIGLVNRIGKVKGRRGI